MESKPQKSPLISPSFCDSPDREPTETGSSEQLQKFHQMAQNIEEIFLMVDAFTMQAIYVNPACEKITGRTCESLQQAPLSYREIIHPYDRLHVLGQLEEAL